MIAILFLAIGLFFFWMVFKAISSQEILARGWGFSIRIYSRENEPVKYWVTFSCYIICAVWATAFAVLMLLK